MSQKIISSENAPAAVGPYSHAVQVGNLVFTSGQIGLDPLKGTLVEGVEAQADQVLHNLENVLKSAGLTMNDVVKTTVFLEHVEDFGKVNDIYAKHFGNHKPARSCVEVSALPMGALVEIEVIAEQRK